MGKCRPHTIRFDPGDLILKVEIPVQNRRSAYHTDQRERPPSIGPLVSCAAAAKVDGGKLSQVKIVLGAVSPVPHQVKAANDFLEGKTLDDAAASKAADLILEKAACLPNTTDTRCRSRAR